MQIVGSHENNVGKWRTNEGTMKDNYGNEDNGGQMQERGDGGQFEKTLGKTREIEATEDKCRQQHSDASEFQGLFLFTKRGLCFSRHGLVFQQA